MGWPYAFVDLSSAEKHLRRQALDRYAGYAQLTAFVPIVLFLIYNFGCWCSRAFKAKKGSYNAIPDSPALKLKRQSSVGTWAARYRQLQWWLGDDVVFWGRIWGQKDEWVFGIGWGVWMLVLSVLETGDDYLHFTKRLGMIAVSQLPLQYLLALKSLNPVAFVFGSSHEQVNRYHRVLGRIVYMLLILHAIFYANFLLQLGILVKRLLAPMVACGVVAFISMIFLNATVLRAVRDYSYRIFFITHLMVAIVLPPLLWFHAPSARVFLVEALLVFFADLASRKLDTFTSKATVEFIPGTTLVKVTAPIPPGKVNRFRGHPGSHIYLNLPAAARPSSNPASMSYLLYEFLFNPFTVASVDEETGEMTLIARHLFGPMTTALRRFATNKTTVSTARGANGHEAAQVSLSIEGPYGVASHFPMLSAGDYDRVLLVSGGVGATYTVPLYRAIIHDNPAVKVQLVWAVRGAGDATWTVSGKDGQGIIDDENVNIFLTGALDGSGETLDGEVELSSMSRNSQRDKLIPQHNRMRPDLSKIVDDTFKHGNEERVAVLFCGPAVMGRDLRRNVGRWVEKGRVVFWHDESFGW